MASMFIFSTIMLSLIVGFFIAITAKELCVHRLLKHPKSYYIARLVGLSCIELALLIIIFHVEMNMGVL